jgi:hypothetical protein
MCQEMQRSSLSFIMSLFPDIGLDDKFRLQPSKSPILFIPTWFCYLLL